MAEQAINLRSITNERNWIPRDLNDTALIRRALLGHGVPADRVAGMVGWLAAKATGEPDLTTATTRARYRKVLAEVQSPLPSRNGATVGLLSSSEAA